MVQQHLQVGDYSSVISDSIQTNYVYSRRRRFVPPVRDSQSRVNRIGKPGSKRYQRFVNKEYLMQQQWDLEMEDFQCVRFGLTPFSPLFEEHNKRIWEPFLDITEEEEQMMLKQLKERKLLSLEQKDEFGDWVMVDNEEDFEDLLEPRVDASISILKIQKNIRKFIKKNPDSSLLFNLDKEIFEYVESTETSLTYTFESSYQRMMCHGVCQYYSLCSRSEDQEDGSRKMIITRPKKGISLLSQTFFNHLSMVHWRTRVIIWCVVYDGGEF